MQTNNVTTEKFFTSSKKTIKKIVQVPTLKAKVDALMEMMNVLVYGELKPSRIKGSG